MSSFDGLLDASAYEDDEPVRVAAGRAELWVHERLWNRLWHIGCAYELHLLRLVDGGSERVTVNAGQAASLIDELEFVGSVTKDRALLATIDDMTTVAARAVRAGNDGALIIEGP